MLIPLLTTVACVLVRWCLTFDMFQVDKSFLATFQLRGTSILSQSTPDDVAECHSKLSALDSISISAQHASIFFDINRTVGRSEKHLLPDGLSIKRKDPTLCGTDNDNIPPRWRWSSASFYCSSLHCCCATLWFLWMAMVIIMVIMVMVNIFYRASATDARYWYSKSVRPSVRPLRSGIRWKRLNVSS